MKILLTILLCLLPLTAQAKFAPRYLEATIKTMLVVSQYDPEILVPDLPANILKSSGMVLVYADGHNYYSYPIKDMSKLGHDCIAHIVYSKEVKDDVEALPGYISGDATDNEIYKAVITTTVEDAKIQEAKQEALQEAIKDNDAKKIDDIQTNKEVFTYDGADKDKAVPVWDNLDTTYVDK